MYLDKVQPSGPSPSTLQWPNHKSNDIQKVSSQDTFDVPSVCHQCKSTINHCTVKLDINIEENNGCYHTVMTETRPKRAETTLLCEVRMYSLFWGVRVFFRVESDPYGHQYKAL